MLRTFPSIILSRMFSLLLTWISSPPSSTLYYSYIYYFCRNILYFLVTLFQDFLSFFLSFVLSFFSLSFLNRLHNVSQADLELMVVLLLHPPKRWVYRYVSQQQTVLLTHSVLAHTMNSGNLQLWCSVYSIYFPGDI